MSLRHQAFPDILTVSEITGSHSVGVDATVVTPFAEFAYNNSVTTSMGISPFYDNFGFHSRKLWGKKEDIKNPTSLNYVHWTKPVHEQCLSALEKTCERMRNYDYQHHSKAPTLLVGDLVLLNLRNVKTKQPSRMFDHKFQGPLNVSQVLSKSPYKLELPKKWRIHNVFHVSLLEPYRKLSDPDQKYPTPEQILEEVGEVKPEGGFSDEYSHRAIKDIVKVGREIRYLVEWENYPEAKDWMLEARKHVEGCPELVWQFWEDNWKKPLHERFITWGNRNNLSITSGQ